MTDAFSTPAEHAFDHPEIEAVVEAGPSSFGDALTDVSIEEAFEVDDTISRILSGGYKTIGLQFPDELLPCSVQVFKAIQEAIQSSGAQAYVLADSTYGSCCPDVLSCLHLPADFLVHYGHACLTPTDALPVHYVFPRRRLDIKHALDNLMDVSRDELAESGDSTSGDDGKKKGIIVIWDVAYDWLASDIEKQFTAQSPFLISFATIQRPASIVQPATERGKEKAPALRSIHPPEGLALDECVLWYIGEEGRSQLNLQMNHAGSPLFAYSPSSQLATALHPQTSRLLSRRLFALHQAMSSDIFGLIVGNVGLASSKPLLQQLRAELKKAKKKSYTLSVGRLNPAKLANFETIECFVLVGCAEGGVVDSKDFYRPIITPWELLLALKGPEAGWDPSKWTLDIEKVLQTAREEHQPEEADKDEEDSEDDEPQFDLVTGTYRTRKVFNDGRQMIKNDIPAEGMSAMTLRNNEFSISKLESAGSNYLASREWQGLEARYGQDEPAVLEEGRSGIARGYKEEK